MELTQAVSIVKTQLLKLHNKNNINTTFVKLQKFKLRMAAVIKGHFQRKEYKKLKLASEELKRHFTSTKTDNLCINLQNDNSKSKHKTIDVNSKIEEIETDPEIIRRTRQRQFIERQQKLLELKKKQK